MVILFCMAMGQKDAKSPTGDHSCGFGLCSSIFLLPNRIFLGTQTHSHRPFLSKSPLRVPPRSLQVRRSNAWPREQKQKCTERREVADLVFLIKNVSLVCLDKRSLVYFCCVVCFKLYF